MTREMAIKLLRAGGFEVEMEIEEGDRIKLKGIKVIYPKGVRTIVRKSVFYLPD